MLIVTPLFSQQGDVISFEASNEPLRAVLDRLAAKHQINITYNASNPAFDQRVNFVSSNKAPMDVLREILTLNGHEYRYSGNHMMILKSPDYIAQSIVGQSQAPTEKEDNISTSGAATDTLSDPNNQLFSVPIVIRDTLIIHDTIILTSTRVIVDTVFIEVAPQSAASRPESLIRDVFGIQANGRERWAVGFSFSQMLAGFGLATGREITHEQQRVLDAEQISLRNFGLGTSVQYNAGSFVLAAHLGINSFAHRFSWSELSVSGGYNQIDTLDSFFTLTQNDTIWTHITDTIWIPLDSQEIIFDRMNRMGLFATGLSGSYIFMAGRNATWYARAGFTASTPLWLNAKSVVNEDGFPAEDVSRANFNRWMFSWNAGLGTKMRINAFSDLLIETWYRRYINEWNTNHPLDRRMHGAGVRVGLLYYF